MNNFENKNLLENSAQFFWEITNCNIAFLTSQSSNNKLEVYLLF